jgi:hypothetical protein
LTILGDMALFGPMLANSRLQGTELSKLGDKFFVIGVVVYLFLLPSFSATRYLCTEIDREYTCGSLFYAGSR